jgi:hypothetical protein
MYSKWSQLKIDIQEWQLSPSKFKWWYNLSAYLMKHFKPTK